MNTHGEVFEAAYDGELPRVRRARRARAQEIAIQYRLLPRSAGARSAQAPVQVQRLAAPRLAGEARRAALTLELGREQIEARLARFVARLRPHGRRSSARRVDYVDLRYPNGFAVRVPELRARRRRRARARKSAGDEA